jgi:heme/copper-type cytochrome/quinol oxidase subunit 1
MKTLRIILTIVFGWLGLKGLEVLVRPTTVDRAIFVQTGSGWLFWVLVPGTVALMAAAVWYLWRPSKLGYRIAQAALGLHLVESLVGALLGFRHPEILREAVIASRRARELPVRPELLELLEHPVMKTFMVGFVIVVTVVPLVLLFFFERARRAGHHVP